MIPVIWFTASDGPARACWDQNVIDWLCPPSYFHHMNQHAPRPLADGAVFVIPARYNLADVYINTINAELRKYAWVVVILTSDEESLFPWHRLSHPSMKIWVQYPHPSRHKNPSLRYLPIGAPNLEPAETFRAEREQIIDVWFRGQKNHLRRDQAIEAFSDWGSTRLEATPGFTQGLQTNEYLLELSLSKIALCPSGPASADSFRCWEALELGVVPIVDQGPISDPEGRAITSYPRTGFWDLMFNRRQPPFPVVDEWSQAPGIAQVFLTTFPGWNNVVFAWYQWWKRSLRLQLLADIEELGGNYAGPPGSNITVLIPTSPTPNNPAYLHLAQTIESVTERLPNAEIILMLDGVRLEQSHRRADYEEYVRRVLWKCNHSWPNVVPRYFDEHLHQAEMTRRTLEEVRTDYVLFVEHDTPLMGVIPWQEWLELLHKDCYDVIRTYHETILQPEHMHLMEDQYGDYLATHQWSQRPHMAKTSWYRTMLDRWFTPHSRTMIEDPIHGIAQEHPDEFRLALYTPSGDIQRAGHLDARGEDPKYGMVF